MAAWRDQLLEVLGAMGLREVRRLRGELGRVIFQPKEEVAFRSLFGRIVSGHPAAGPRTCGEGELKATCAGRPPSSWPLPSKPAPAVRRQPHLLWMHLSAVSGALGGRL